MVNIRITDLPSEASPLSTEVLAIDGASTRKATISAVVLAGRPTASQAEAEAGTDPTKAMVPLTTKQAITEQALTKVGNLSGLSDASAARTNLGLVIGTNVQAYDADLTALGGLAKTDGNFIVGNGTTWVAESGATARASLGLGSAAVAATGDFATAAQGALADTAVQPEDIDALGLPVIVANTMLVDNAAGTARETKTFAQVNERLGSFTTKTLAAAATIDTTITSVRLGGGTTLGDGLGGLYISTNNGSADTFSSNGGTRTWYRALFDSPTIAPGDAGKIVAVNATEDGFALEVLAAASLPTPFVDVASATTVDLGAAASSSVNITGTTTITGFGASAPDGAEYLLKFAGAVTVTHGASLILPEATDVVAYAGMTMRVRKELGNVWRVIWYSSRLDIAGGGANRIKFDAAALTASRTITLPDADVTLSSPALPQNIVVFGASGTYTKPAGLKAAKVTVIGGGGGGGGKKSVVSTAGGGAGGGTAISILLAASIGATETVTIGAGGAGGTTSGTDGGNGGSSSFGSLVVATGGTGGSGSTVNRTGRDGGIGTTGQLLIRGGRGGASSLSSVEATSCGASILGATGCAGSGTTGVSAGDAPPNSGGGGGPGSGSTTTPLAGAAGGSGVVIVEEYY